MVDKALPVLLRKRSYEALGVQWMGDVKRLPMIFRKHMRESITKGKLVVDRKRGWAIVKRGNTVQGLRPGDWLLRDEEGNLEVMGASRVSEEWEVLGKPPGEGTFG